MMKDALSRTVFFLSALGAIHLGVVGLLKYDFIAYLGTNIPIPYLEAVIYTIIGLSGLYSLVAMFYSPVCD